MSEVSDTHRVVRRLEAFSDIVIAFSLGQIGLNLVVPPHARDFVAHPVGILAFLITFCVLASFWWLHSAIFRNYFVPNPLMVFLNFAALALTLLQVFALQLWLHFGPVDLERIDAARIYFGTFAFTFSVLAAMLALGTYYRRHELSPSLRIWGIGRSIRVAATALGTALGTARSSGVTSHGDALKVAVLGPDRSVQVVLAIPYQILLGFAGGALAGAAIATLVGRLLAAKRNGDRLRDPRRGSSGPD